MAEDKGQALEWDDEVSDDGGFVILPPGTYQFMVSGFERKRFEGSAKMSPCPKAELSLQLITETGVETITTNLMLNTKTAWRVANFFEGLGFQKNEETGKIPMAWNQIIGKQGWLELIVRKYTKDGKEYEANDVDKYLPPSEWPEQNQTYAAPVATAPAIAAPMATPGQQEWVMR